MNRWLGLIKQILPLSVLDAWLSPELSARLTNKFLEDASILPINLLVESSPTSSPDAEAVLLALALALTSREIDGVVLTLANGLVFAALFFPRGLF